MDLLWLLASTLMSSGVTLVLLGWHYRAAVWPRLQDAAEAVERERRRRKAAEALLTERMNAHLERFAAADRAALETNRRVREAGRQCDERWEAFQAHGPHVREHDCRLELGSVEAGGLEHIYRCAVERGCKTRLVLKAMGVFSHVKAT